MRGPSQAFTFPRSHFKSPGEKSPGKNARTKLEGRKYNVPHGNHYFSCLWFGYLESRKHISRKRKKKHPSIAGIQSTNKLANQNPVSFYKEVYMIFGVFAHKIFVDLIFSITLRSPWGIFAPRWSSTNKFWPRWSWHLSSTLLWNFCHAGWFFHFPKSNRVENKNGQSNKTLSVA